MPVTSKAQESAEYQDYLAREGEDSDTHYKVKIEAAKLLLNHTQDTFTTPVFSGSASLRDAAGQLIEKTAKSVRRKETVDEAYTDKLFDDVTALYHLNDTLQSTAGKQDLGPLPTTSVVLLSVIGAAWVLILLYVVWQQLQKSKRGD